jgi:hypothetical protein
MLTKGSILNTIVGGRVAMQQTTRLTPLLDYALHSLPTLFCRTQHSRELEAKTTEQDSPKRTTILRTVKQTSLNQSIILLP